MINCSPLWINRPLFFCNLSAVSLADHVSWFCNNILLCILYDYTIISIQYYVIWYTFFISFKILNSFFFFTFFTMWNICFQFLLLGAVPFPSDVKRLKELGVSGVVTMNEPYETLVPTALYQVSLFFFWDTLSATLLLPKPTYSISWLCSVLEVHIWF